MVFTRHLRLALAGTALLLSFVGRADSASSFGFTDCVASCIYTSGGCQTGECMCSDAKNEILLDSVVACLFFNCKSDLRNYEDAFLDPIEELCEDIDQDIPGFKIKAAESLASSYISKLPAETTAKSSSAVAAPTPDPTTTVKPTAPTTEASTPSETSTADADEDDDAESTLTTENITSPTQVTTPPAATGTSTTSSSESATPDSGSPDSNSSDEDSDSAAWRTQTSLSLLGLPLALVLLGFR